MPRVRRVQTLVWGQETLRYNCDPFDEHRSDDIWMALEEAQLAGWVREQFGREESKEKCLSLESLGFFVRGLTTPSP